MDKRHQKRETDWRYAHQGDWDRLCTCGHTLGVHSAGSPADCLLYSLSPADRAQELARPEQRVKDVDCKCPKFTLSRRAAAGDGSRCEQCGRVIRPFEAREPLDAEGTRFEHAPACPPVRY